MKFEPAPANEFPFFISTYFSRCREVCPKLRCIAGKWTHEDLIPGLSDFDTRLIFDDDMKAADWADASVRVGQVHTSLAWEHPGWARILEHLPGLNLTAEEMVDPLLYYPEFPQWTFYHGSAAAISAIEEYLRARHWSVADELFHLKKFARYCGPYQRGIDPPINLGAWEHKYPLHSRFLHYFVPPLQSAVSIVLGKPLRGKLEALRLASDLFPSPEIVHMVLDAVGRHYEIPEFYEEPRLTAVEEDLERYLWQVWSILASRLTVTQSVPEGSPAGLRRLVAALPVDPRQSFFESSKFSRLMRGRLSFYSAPPPSFDSSYLIGYEVRRVVANFYHGALNAFSRAYWGEDLQAQDALQRLRGDLVAPAICDEVVRFVELAADQSQPVHHKAAALAERFHPLQMMLETLGGALRRSRGAWLHATRKQFHKDE